MNKILCVPGNCLSVWLSHANVIPPDHHHYHPPTKVRTFMVTSTNYNCYLFRIQPPTGCLCNKFPLHYACLPLQTMVFLAMVYYTYQRSYDCEKCPVLRNYILQDMTLIYDPPHKANFVFFCFFFYFFYATLTTSQRCCT